MANPQSQEAANASNELRSTWQEKYENIMMIRNDEERLIEKKGRWRQSWDILRGATRKLKEVIQGDDHKKKFKINFEAIERKRKKWQENSTLARSSQTSSSTTKDSTNHSKPPSV